MNCLPVQFWRVCVVVGLFAPGAGWSAGEVVVRSVPHEGIQPQVAVDARGAVHLIYFAGDPKRGDVFYTRQEAGDEAFGSPMRVNRRDGSAIAVGTIRGPHMALGRGGRVHVVWNGSAASHDGDHAAAPLFYTRLNDAGTGFEAERNIIRYAYGLDGGSSVAADGDGRVHVVWHASPPGNTKGEAGRAVFLATSTDEGMTFSRERVISPEGTGACGCCGLKAYADRRGDAYVLYRAARGGTNRDEILLAARGGRGEFEAIHAHAWPLSACPMSSAFLGESPAGALAAWETKGQVYFTAVAGDTFQPAPLMSPPGEGKRKHPVAARNDDGETLLVWLEGSGWNQGGTLAWQVFGRDGRPAVERGGGGKLPVWGLAACYARPNGTFVILR